jgi:hypothetical protein
VVQHSIGIVAVWIDVVQAPLVVQYAQAVPDPWWKWWLPLLISILAPLLSAAASIYIASKVFRSQSGKDRQQWVRDQEKGEWSAILVRLTAVDVRLPHVFNNPDWFTLTNGLLQEMRNALPAMRNAVFIAEHLERDNLIVEARTFVSNAAERIKLIDQINLMLFNLPTEGPPERMAEVNIRRIMEANRRLASYQLLVSEFNSLAKRIRKAARSALLSTGEVEEQNPET